MIWGKDLNEIKESLKAQDDKLNAVVSRIEKNTSELVEFKNQVTSKIEEINGK